MSKYAYLLAPERTLADILFAATASRQVTRRDYGDIPGIVIARDVFRESEDGHLTIINPSKPYKPAY